MRYLALTLTIAVAAVVSGCTTSYLGSVGSYEPGYVYSGYGPAYLGATGIWALSPGAMSSQPGGPIPARDHSGR